MLVISTQYTVVIVEVEPTVKALVSVMPSPVSPARPPVPVTVKCPKVVVVVFAVDARVEPVLCIAMMSPPVKDCPLGKFKVTDV